MRRARAAVCGLSAALLLCCAPVAAAAPAQDGYIGGADSYVPYQAQMGGAPQGLAVTGITGVVTLPGLNAVSVFSTCQPKSCLPGQQSSPIAVGAAPSAVAITPDGATAYVSNSGGGTVSVVSVTGLSAATAPIAVGGSPAGLALIGSRLYVALNSTDRVAIVEPALGTVVGTIPVGGAPSGMAASGALLYVTNTTDGTVSVISTASSTVVATIPVGAVPGGVAVSPDGLRAYVANNGSGSVSVIDTATNTVVGTIPVGRQPWGVAVAPDGATAFVANYGDGTVSVIDTASRRVVAVVTVGPQPFGIAATGTGLVLSANAGGTTVAAIPLSAPTYAPEWSVNRRTRTVTGVVVPLTSAVEYAISAKRGTVARSGTCVASGTKVTCSVRLPKGAWRISVTTRLPWQKVAGGSQNKLFRL